MCTLILSVGARAEWPLLLAANRDERLDRPWRPPGLHWPDQPDVMAGQDAEAGGTWLGINRAGVVAAVLNRQGSLGPAPGKRSRGELPLLALRHASAAAAAHAIAGLDAGHWRSFNLVLADRAGAFFLRGTGHKLIASHPLASGTHMVTSRDPDDTDSPRIARNLPRFRRGPLPAPPDWSGWPALLADRTPPADAAINVAPTGGFGTVSSALIALEHVRTRWDHPSDKHARQNNDLEHDRYTLAGSIRADHALGAKTCFLTTNGPPDTAPFEPVHWPAEWI